MSLRKRNNMKIEKLTIKEVLPLAADPSLTLRAIAERTGWHRTSIKRLRLLLPTCPYDLSNLEDVPVSELTSWFKTTPEVQSIRYDEPDVLKLSKSIATGRSRLELFDEYRVAISDLPKLQYRSFCSRIFAFAKQPKAVFRIEHKPGESMQVDFAGETPTWLDVETGIATQRQLFVAVLDCSSYIFACSCENQTTAEWLKVHVRALEFFQGAPAVWVCDNLKAAVVVARRGTRLKLNPAYRHLAYYYGATIQPARPYRPTDKGKVEASVKLVQGKLIEKLRTYPATSIEDLDRKILDVVNAINDRPMTQYNGTSRRTFFEELDRPALTKLPSRPFESFEVAVNRVIGRDYMVEFDGNHYSVDHRLIDKRVDVQASSSLLMIVHDGVVVSTHARLRGKGALSITPSHRPENHAAMVKTDFERLSEKLDHQAENASEYIQRGVHLATRPQSKRAAISAALDILSAFKAPEIEAATRWCEAMSLTSMPSLQRCLAGNLWMRAGVELVHPSAKPHGNIRGAEYYAAFKQKGAVQ
jgi:transposase